MLNHARFIASLCAFCWGLLIRKSGVLCSNCADLNPALGNDLVMHEATYGSYSFRASANTFFRVESGQLEKLRADHPRSGNGAKHLALGDRH
ncbi:hypothetical protein Bind_3304 [Beijerinckia indica subsp. indica ATCC 9039]|uniref:Uncharacterized protein n=1 Tax=Beijerinckia indica subsp. indica (strain ATCC 9039 / DSM 1715 / NCIMB 8712) TaxID=395963 RepID=B2IDT1_BEII9|nr:hypothetical protein Bind_3304 [Beijerinckia indica subsp. indica ATCC 9039]